MSKILIVALAAVGTLLAGACSGAGGSDRLRVGKEKEPGPGGSAGGSGSNRGGAGNGSVATGTNALSVDVRDVDEMVIEVITLACAGDCADVEAVAHGGHPPYSFAWEDGSKSAQRHVCLADSSKLTVSATDTAIVADEFHYDAHTSTAEVTATVLACADAGSVPAGDLCIDNPSFEGTARGAVASAAPWTSCALPFTDNNAIWDSSKFTSGWQVDPTDGATFLVTSSNGGVGAQGASQPLCHALTAGATHHFLVDLAQPIEPGVSTTPQPTMLQVWAGQSSCALTELLWTSPVLGETWKTYCVSLAPTADATYLTLVPSVPGNPATGGRLTADHIVPVDACP